MATATTTSADGVMLPSAPRRVANRIAGANGTASASRPGCALLACGVRANRVASRRRPMRGIAGIIRFDHGPVNPAEVNGLIQAMAICATDRIGQCCEGPVGLAHLIQFYCAEDRFESQPLRSRDGELLLVTDALLDNRDELATAFDWHADEAGIRPDSAFVLAAYARWGEACTSHLEGQFALVAWHRRARRLFCAVDHLGHRPLYYWQRNSELVLATTLRGLCSLSRVSRQLHDDTLAAFVARIPLEDRAATLYRDVQQLPGGHQMTIDANGPRTVRYWNPDPNRLLRFRTDTDYVESFRGELERAVRSCVQRSPGNVGVMVSGGLDSAAVTAVAGRILAGQGRRLQAFHLVPEGENLTSGPLRELDETRFAQALQRHAPHIDFHFLPNRGDLFQPGEWDPLFEDNFVPFRHLPARGNPLLELLREQLDLRALLNGGGGNYLVSLEGLPSGYLTQLFLTGRWRAWLRESRGRRRIYGDSLLQLFRKTVLGPLKHTLALGFSTATRPHVFMLNREFRVRSNIEDRLRDYESSWSGEFWRPRKALCRVLTEVAAQHTGVTGSVIRRSVVARIAASPLLDRRFNEFCLALPFDQQIRNGWDRRLLRESMRGLLPEAVRLRITRGFPQPAFHRLFQQSEAILRQELERLSRSAPVRAYLDIAWLRRWADAGQNSPAKYSRTLIDSVLLGRFLEWHSHGTAGATTFRSPQEYA